MPSAAQILNKAAELLRPPPRLTVSEWADTYRQLSAETAAIPGQWSTDRVPYAREIMDAISDPAVHTVVWQSSAQVGKTEVLNNIAGYFMDYDPCPVLVLQPTVEMAETWSKDRLSPMLRDTPVLTEKVRDPKSRTSGNTILHKTFPGGHITMVGANAPAGLASRPIRVVLADEIDRYPASAGSEGDPLSLANKRTQTYWNRKRVYVSTPTIKHVSRVERAREQSDDRRYHVPCPHCDGYQELHWSGVEWPKGEPQKAFYRCAHCGMEIEERHKARMVKRGRWVATRPFRGVAGFWTNELVSLFSTWGKMAEEFLDAKGDPETLRVWVNTALGQTWEDDQTGEQLDWMDLYERREPYSFGEVPDERICYVGATVDTQDDRFEICVKGWAPGEESWNLDYFAIAFAAAADEHETKQSLSHAFDELDRWMCTAEYRHPSGNKLPLRYVIWDSAGHLTEEVYKMARRSKCRVLRVIKGHNGKDAPLLPTKPKKVKPHSVHLWTVGVNRAKDAISRRLQLVDDGPIVHFSEDFTQDYFEGLCAEAREERYSMGQRYHVWAQKRKRNEPWDLEAYHYIGLRMMRPNLDAFAKLLDREPEAPKTRPPRKKRSSMASW